MLANGEYLRQFYNRGISKSLEVGDKVMVHPSTRPDGTPSIAREPFEAMIVIKSYDDNHDRVCTHVEGGHSAWINDYLFNRLEFISR